MSEDGRWDLTRRFKGLKRVFGKWDRGMGRPRQSWGIVLKRVFEKWGGGSDLIWLRLGLQTGSGSCECGNETSVSIKFLD